LEGVLFIIQSEIVIEREEKGVDAGMRRHDGVG
jgi:hypothetical protein